MLITLIPSRIRSFRLAMILNETQHNDRVTLARAHDDQGFYHDSIQFLKLLEAAAFYAKRESIDLLDIPLSTFMEIQTMRMVADFVKSSKAKSEEMERSKMEASIQSLSKHLKPSLCLD